MDFLNSFFSQKRNKITTTIIIALLLFTVYFFISAGILLINTVTGWHTASKLILYPIILLLPFIPQNPFLGITILTLIAISLALAYYSRKNERPFKFSLPLILTITSKLLLLHLAILSFFFFIYINGTETIIVRQYASFDFVYQNKIITFILVLFALIIAIYLDKKYMLPLSLRSYEYFNNIQPFSLSNHSQNQRPVQSKYSSSVHSDPVKTTIEKQSDPKVIFLLCESCDREKIMNIRESTGKRSIEIDWLGQLINPTDNELDLAIDVLSLTHRADEAGKNKDYHGAIQLYQEALKISSLDPILHMSLGVVYHYIGDSFNAKKYLIEALSLAPDNYPEITRIETNLKKIMNKVVDSGITHQPEFLETNNNISSNNPDNDIFEAVNSENIVAIKKLIKNGMKLNINRDGLSPLHLACETGNITIIKMLVRNGIKLDQKDINGNTPLMASSSRGDYKAVSCLISNNARLNIKDNSGRTALHFAAMEGHEKVVSLLVQKGSKVNIRDRDGNTPIQYAYNHDYKDIVKYLIKRGGTFIENDSTDFSIIPENEYCTDNILTINRIGPSAGGETKQTGVSPLYYGYTDQDSSAYNPIDFGDYSEDIKAGDFSFHGKSEYMDMLIARGINFRSLADLIIVPLLQKHIEKTKKYFPDKSTHNKLDSILHHSKSISESFILMTIAGKDMNDVLNDMIITDQAVIYLSFFPLKRDTWSDVIELPSTSTGYCDFFFKIFSDAESRKNLSGTAKDLCHLILIMKPGISTSSKINMAYISRDNSPFNIVPTDMMSDTEKKSLNIGNYW